MSEANPDREIRRLLEFAGIGHAPEKVADLSLIVKQPPTLDRHKDHDLSAFDPDDIAFTLKFPRP